ncbi:PD-(D/E)XK nuclease family protein, partial [Thalassiella azotivora]
PERTAEPGARVARVLAAGRSAAADGADAEAVLWALWDATGLAPVWRRQALAGGPGGRRADRDLDAVVALFDAAGRFVDRLPASGAYEFLAHLDAQDVPADTLAERASGTDAVALLTAQGAAGREWDLVVVAGVQDGVWPDLRLRGSLLGAQDLVDVVTDRRLPGGRASGGGAGGGAGVGTDHAASREAAAAARAQVLADERRLLHVAVSRSRDRVVVTAVRDADERPSPFVDLVDPPALPGAEAPGQVATLTTEGERRFTAVPRQVSLPALVAELRQVLLTADGHRDGSGRVVTAARRSEATRQLGRLARAGVPGAHPGDWYGLADLAGDGPLRAPQEAVRVSPSKVESFGRCPLRWLLESSGGTAGDSTSQSVGTLVHDVAAEHPDGSHDELAAALERRWATLGLPRTWIGARERERADAMVRRLAQYLAASGRELVAVEEDFSARVGRADVRGRVDRLERDADGRLVVVDLKTGSSRPGRDEVAEHAQLATYQVAVEAGAFAEHGTSSGGAALVQVGGSYAKHAEQKQPPLQASDDPQWARRLLEDVADGMAAAAFEAVENSLCRVCPVAASCPVQPEGRQVGQQ